MGNLGEQWRGSRFPRTPQLTGEGTRGPLRSAWRLAPSILGPADALRCGLEVAQGAGDDTGMERNGDAQGGGDVTGIEKGDDGRMGWRRVAPGWSGMEQGGGACSTPPLPVTRGPEALPWLGSSLPL